MKKLSVFVLLVSLIAWGCDKSSSTSTTAGGKQVAGRIVYVNTDTLLNKYDYYKDISKASENKRFQLENDLQNKARTFQNKVAFFQQRAQQGHMTQEQAQTTQMQLQQEEQNLMAYRDKNAQQLAQEEAKKTEDILNKIHDYLKEFNTGDKYDMVIGYSKGGGVLFAKEDLDITKQVLEGLNKKYAEDKKSGKITIEKDSTAKK
ncbi:OmpH family outer membrane protein [Emticicia sp. BO119]|uniref:OmpH family outer membrane protein n=1 Tax=Emticicia sp. BO119 TaxID=2757768 RepID=UPI0015F0A461|nr:OmpH family outer membrane protein [Emticicia sp. BO119]MBA4850928.1 OmpH family outer membrane protein [Emticicia sp. BO119]